jgi:hypothetical protein
MKVASRESELHAEIAGLRDLLERERLDSDEVRSRSVFRHGCSMPFMRPSSRPTPLASFYIGTTLQRACMAGQPKKRSGETSWS